MKASKEPTGAIEEDVIKGEGTGRQTYLKKKCTFRKGWRVIVPPPPGQRVAGKYISRVGWRPEGKNISNTFRGEGAENARKNRGKKKGQAFRTRDRINESIL